MISLQSHAALPLIVEVPGLPMFNLPDTHDNFQQDGIYVDSTAAASFVAHGCSSAKHPKEILRELKLPLEVPELSTNPRLELELYLKDISAKRTCDLSTCWIPLVAVNEDQDEGLQFPPHTERLHQLLLMALANEKIVSKGAREYAIKVPAYGSFASPQAAKLDASKRLSRILNVKPETLLTENSLPAPSLARRNIAVPVVDLTANDSSATEQDWPVVVSRMSTTVINEDINTSDTNDTDQNTASHEAELDDSPFEQAFNALIEERMAPLPPSEEPECKQLPDYVALPDVSPEDVRASRLPLHELSKHQTGLPLAEVGAGQHANLPWAPIPANSAKVSLDEDIHAPENTFATKTSLLPRSTQTPKPKCLNYEDTPIPQSPATNLDKHKTSLHLNGLSALWPGGTGNSANQDLLATIRSSLAEGNGPGSFEESRSLLPRSNDTTATSTLIAGFMELRKAARHRR